MHTYYKYTHMKNKYIELFDDNQIFNIYIFHTQSLRPFTTNCASTVICLTLKTLVLW